MKLTKEQIIDVIMEGVDDPGILKCVFMAGGPGSGKSFTAKEIFGVGKEYTNSFSATGLKIVNSDTAFEKGLKDNGIDPKDLGRIEKEEPELWDKITRNPGGIRAKAKALTQKQQSFYEQGRLGMIIDGTGDDFGKIKKKVERAKSLGYDCYMVFVNTSLEVALERNRNRDRTLSDELVTGIWKDVQQNLGKFQGLFGGNMVIVDNTVYKPIDSQVQKAVNRFISRPIYNPIGKEWIKTARALKKAKLIKAGKEMNNKPTIEERINLFVEENVPTDPTKWSYAKSQAKQKFDVYPSAYANAWAAKKYKELGGGWRKGKSEGAHSFSAMSATRAALKKRKKESVDEGIIQDREKELQRLPKGAKVSGGGYGPFVKTHSNTFKNPKTGKLYHSAALASFIGGFKDFKINEGMTEAGLKGTENIPSNKKLSQLSDNDKLNILQSGGNIISFHIPDWAKGRYKMWQVISAGKINKKKDLDGEIIYFLPGKGPQKASPTYKSVKDLINGVDWDTMEMRRESVNEAKQEVSDSVLRKLQDAIRKVDPKIRVFISNHPATKGKLEIQIPDNDKWAINTDKVTAIVHKITGDHRTGRIFFEGKVDEGLFSDIMKGVKKGTPPYSIVVIVNNKVVKQVQVKEDRAIPAHFTTLKKEYPNSRIRVESSTGQILFEK